MGQKIEKKLSCFDYVNIPKYLIYFFLKTLLRLKHYLGSNYTSIILFILYKVIEVRLGLF